MLVNYIKTEVTLETITILSFQTGNLKFYNIMLYLKKIYILINNSTTKANYTSKTVTDSKKI